MKNHKNSSVSYICSRYYRAPELLLGYKYYDKSIDMWSVGCVMAELVLGKPIFQGTGTLDQLIRVLKVLGTPNWRKLSFIVESAPKLPEITAKGLKNVLSPKTSPLFVDLLEKILVINPIHRISAG
jgi:serine/threonine protein kinase